MTSISRRRFAQARSAATQTAAVGLPAAGRTTLALRFSSPEMQARLWADFARQYPVTGRLFAAIASARG